MKRHRRGKFTVLSGLFSLLLVITATLSIFPPVDAVASASGFYDNFEDGITGDYFNNVAVSTTPTSKIAFISKQDSNIQAQNSFTNRGIAIPMVAIDSED